MVKPAKRRDSPVKKCQQCGKKFRSSKSGYQAHAAKFCSQKCSREAIGKRRCFPEFPEFPQS